MFVEVIINNNAKALNRTFDYSVPKELENLIFIAKLKIKAHMLYISHLNIKRKLVTITFAENHKIDGQSVVDIVNKFCGAIRVINGSQVSLTYRANPNDSPSIEKSLKIAETIINSLKLQEGEIKPLV